MWSKALTCGAAPSLVKAAIRTLYCRSASRTQRKLTVTLDVPSDVSCKRTRRKRRAAKRARLDSVRIVFLLVAIAAAGCDTLTGISSEFPSGSPEVTRASPGCPNLDGEYENVAHYSYLVDTDANKLAERLAWGRAATVIIRSEGDQLNLVFQGSQGERFFRKLSAPADFECLDGGLVLRPMKASGADGTGGYRSERRLMLRRAVNGDLIGEERLVSVGALLWVLPIVGSQTYWYRWRRATAG